MSRTTNKYYTWLRGLVNGLDPFYDSLFETAWNVVYEWHVPNDDNRAVDGIELRDKFERETSLLLLDLGNECIMLEFLIGLAVRVNEVSYDFQNPNRVPFIFWELAANLGLVDARNSFEIRRIFKNLNDRKYDSNGEGGLFPLRNPGRNQREVEIWYQMMEYLNENM